MLGRLKKLGAAIDDRSGLSSLWRYIADEEVPGGARFAYVFGSALLFTFAIQVVTGITLASAYSPSVTDAWGSVYYIQNEMTLGWLVRGIHHFGSSAMIVLAVLHMTQTFMYGAYRKPRELNWIIGCILLLLILGFGLTGYLLPWDQKGYWATQVATSIMGGTPGGEYIQEVLQGGDTYGNATLTRFYAIHVFILPVSMLLLVTAHVALFRRHGVTPRPGRSDEELEKKQVAFWPFQVFYDLVFSLVVLATIIALVLGVGVSLEAPADPASAYEARPEWYFLFLFQLLKYFEGPMTIVGTVIIPTLAFGFLFIVPFIDKREDGKRAWPSKKVLVPYALLMLGAAALTAIALSSDASSESFKEGRAAADAEAKRASELAALGGIDARGRVVLFEGEKLFHEKGCASCHAQDADKASRGPLLKGYGSAERIKAFLKAPDDPAFFGHTMFAGLMEAMDGSDEELDQMVAYLMALGGHVQDPKAVQVGKAYFDDNCTDCHNKPELRVGAEGYDREAAGPDLRAYQSAEWTRRLIIDASHPELFGDLISAADRDKVMPPFEDLTDDELDLLVTWLLAGAPGAD